MADDNEQSTSKNSPAGATPDAKASRRDAVVIAALGFVGVGALLAAWPLVSQWAPHPGTPRPETATVDLARIAEGAMATVPWRQLPILVRHRTPLEITDARRDGVFDDPLARNAALPPVARATDANRTLALHPKWLVVVGLCTRPDCVVRDSGALASGEERVRWFCPCCASRYDGSGRVIKGPALENLAVPIYAIRGSDLIIG